MTARTKILSPRIRLSFGSGGVPLVDLPKIVKLVEAALIDHKLTDCAAECTATNEGRKLRLLNPAGDVVWSRMLKEATCEV